MNKSIKLIFIILFVFITGIIFCLNKKVEASSPASISSSVNSNTITVYVNVSDNVNDWNLSIDGGELGSRGFSTGSARSATFTFTAKENKSYTINLGGSIVEESGTLGIATKTTATVTDIQTQTSDNNQSTSTNNEGTETTKTNTQNTTPTNTTPINLNEKSNNAKLKSLVVSPVDFTGFRPDKSTGYSVIVENNVTEVKISAVPEDSKATVKIAGNKNIQVGNNIVSITVVAEDGTTNVYQVSVGRKDENGNVTDIAVEDNIDIFLENLTIDGVELNPVFQKDVYEYQAVLTQDLEKVNITTKTNDDSIEVSIIGNENLNRGKNNLTILLNSSKSTETKIYKITLVKNLGVDQELLNIEQQNNENKQYKRQLIAKIALGALAFLGFVLVIIKIRKTIKKNKPLPIDFVYFTQNEHKNEDIPTEIDPRTKELFKGKVKDEVKDKEQ